MRSLLRVDLITGFLGAGKTTFIREYLRHLTGENVLVIENEFSSIAVDSRFLRDEPCAIADLSGVCMCCKGREQFRSLLIEAAAHGYDRVLVEPSGIYDVDEFFALMGMSSVGEVCRPGSVLTIVDAGMPRDLSGESAYLMFTQLMAAGAVVLSKTQYGGDVRATVSWLNELVSSFGGRRVLGSDVPVFTKEWKDLTDEDFALLDAAGCHRDAHRRREQDHGEIYDSCFIAGCCRNEADLVSGLRGVMSDSRYGRVLRAKGFIRDVEGNWYEVNCTPDGISVKPDEIIRRGLLVFIGQDLKEEELAAAFPLKKRHAADA